MILLMLSLQATEPAALPAGAPEPFDRIDFDLGKVKRSATDEIVVTARRRDEQRLPPLPATKEEALPRAETGIVGTLRGGVTLEQQQLPGAVSNRAMMKLKLPF